MLFVYDFMGWEPGKILGRAQSTEIEVTIRSYDLESRVSPLSLTREMKNL